MSDFLQSQILLLLEPLGLLWVALHVVAVLAWRRRLRWVAWSTFGLAVFIYLVGSTSLIPRIYQRYERPYAGVDYRTVAPAEAVVILGGGLTPSRYEAGGFHLSLAGDRDFMAMEMLRLQKAPVLVLGGGSGKVDGRIQSESELLKKWLTESGLGHAEIIALGIMANTHDEAVHVHQLAVARGWKDILLVTSAGHMRRSVATFATAGVPVRPLACNFLTSFRAHDSEAALPHIVPSWHNLEIFSVWLHEAVGWYEYRRRGWIRE